MDCVLQKSVDRPGWWILADRHNFIVVRFEEKRYNEIGMLRKNRREDLLKTTKKQPQVQQQPAQTQKVHNRTKGVAAILALLLGGFGVNFFYLGQIGVGIACIIFSFTGIPSLIGVICAIYYICMSNEEFDQKYNM